MSSLAAGPCADVCIGSDDDGDAAEFYSERWVRARTAHKCCECGETIAPGESYQSVAGKWVGAVATFRTCAACAEIRSVFCCEGWIFGFLWEEAEGSLFPIMTTGCLDGLTTSAAKEKVVARWRSWSEAGGRPWIWKTARPTA